MKKNTDILVKANWKVFTVFEKVKKIKIILRLTTVSYTEKNDFVVYQNLVISIKFYQKCYLMLFSINI